MNHLLAFPLTALLSALACGPAPLHAQDDLAKAALSALEARCYRCHGGGAGKNADLDVLNRESVLQPRGEGDVETAFVTPGKPDESLLWQAIESEFMPLDGSPESQAITAEERDTIKRWIEAGASFPQRRDVQFLAQADVLAAILRHLQKTPADDRRYLRFFTLEHLANNPEVSEQELRLHRAALSKLLNSLIWRKRSFALPRAVEGTREAVLAVDLRELDWDESNLWRAVLAENAYGLHYKESADPQREELARDIALYSGVDTPYVRLVWKAVRREPLWRQVQSRQGGCLASRAEGLASCQLFVARRFGSGLC